MWMTKSEFPKERQTLLSSSCLLGRRREKQRATFHLNVKEEPSPLLSNCEHLGEKSDGTTPVPVAAAASIRNVMANRQATESSGTDWTFTLVST